MLRDVKGLRWRLGVVQEDLEKRRQSDSRAEPFRLPRASTRTAMVEAVERELERRKRGR